MDRLYELDAWAHSQMLSAREWLEYSKDTAAELVGPAVSATVWYFAQVTASPSICAGLSGLAGCVAGLSVHPSVRPSVRPSGRPSGRPSVRPLELAGCVAVS